MKKIYFPILVIVCVALLSVALFPDMLTGFRNDNNDNDDDDVVITQDDVNDTDEYGFVPEFTSLSALIGDLPNIRNITVVGNTLFFTSTTEITWNSLFRTTRIFRINLDEPVLTELQNYTEPPRPSDADGGGTIIFDIKIDDDGNIWVLEFAAFVTYDFPPDFNPEGAEMSEIWEHSNSLGTFNNIRKLDSTGAELRTIDINHLTSSDAFSIHRDGDGYIFVGFEQTIYVLNAGGEAIFRLDTEDAVFSNNLVRLSDGRVAFFGRTHDWQTAMLLHPIDVQNQAWGESIILPSQVLNVFSGFDEYLVIVDDGVNLSGIHYETAELVHIFNWIEGVVSPEGLGNVNFLPDGRVLFTTATLEPNRTEVITLNRTPQDDISLRTTLTLATTFITPEISSAVMEFNRTNAFYEIEVNEIDISWESPSADFTRLALDIITGNGPDILVTSELPFHQWAAQGLFVDLYELIDRDPTLIRDDILDITLRNAETNGRLYRMFPRFSIQTMIGQSDVVGSEPSWTMGELVSMLEANPQATSPFGMGWDGRHIFRLMFMNSLDSFVNWELGTVYFDSDYFLELLEYAYRLHEALEWRSDSDYFVFGPDLLSEMFASGEQLVVITDISCFYALFLVPKLIGENFVIKGIPSEDGSGQLMDVALNSLSIMSTSERQEGAWEFIRMILSEDWQRENINELGFPTNRTVFGERVDRALSGDVEVVHWGGFFMGGTDILPEDRSPFVNAALELIGSTDGIVEGFDPLLDIIFETLDDFFRGQITIEDAARIIQNRAQTFVNEQS